MSVCVCVLVVTEKCGTRVTCCRKYYHRSSLLLSADIQNVYVYIQNIQLGKFTGV